jgi:hypothetical protein
VQLDKGIERSALDPTQAQRLSRLRILRADARRRAGDESELGLHLAVLAIDGIGELAIGLCIQHLGVVVKRGAGVPVRLDRLIDHLKITPPGAQGYRELHRVRNLVQHEGVLPAPEQVPRWLTETEQLTDALVNASFGVDLGTVGSAAGVRDPDLRRPLEEVEIAFEQGESQRSFDLSWRVLEMARRQLRQATDLHFSSALSGGSQALAQIDHRLGQFGSEIETLAGQVEMATFTSEPGEWLWFRQRQSEQFRGLPPSIADAGRAFVFVLSCVLEFESYIARHGIDRWERWRAEHRPPMTGLPGGPHIQSVEIGDSPSAHGGKVEGLRQWIFQLTDVPDTEPAFDWAVFTVVDELESSPITNAHLDGVGRLSISCPRDCDEKLVHSSARELIKAAKAKLAVRAIEDAEDKMAEEAILDRFQVGLEAAGCSAKSLQIQLPRAEHRIRLGVAKVFIELGGVPDDSPSWLPVGFKETFEKHFPEYGPSENGSFRTMWADVSVPAVWDPRRVGMWALDAIAFDAAKRRNARKERESKQSAEDRALMRMEKLIAEQAES